MPANAGYLKVNILYNEAGSCIMFYLFLFLCHVLLNSKKCVHDYVHVCDGSLYANRIANLNLSGSVFG